MDKNKIEYVKDTFPEYLSKKDYIAASDIKNFLESPKYYYYEKFEKQKEPQEEQRHYSIGSALHELILEPELFRNNYIVSPKFDRRTKEGKKAYEDFCLQAQGKTILFENEMTMITTMAQNALKHHTFVDLMKESHRELSCYTSDEKTGLKVRMRPDIMCKNKSTIVDVKSCLDSSPRRFKNDVYSYGYSISAAYYCDFLNRENYVFAAIEKEKAFQLSLYVLQDDKMEYGRQQYRMALDLIKWSQDNNYWCDYNEFEVLKECYLLETLDEFFDTVKKSELITIL